MKPKTLALVLITFVALFAAVGSAWWLDAGEPRKKPYPKADPPPPASDVFTPSAEAAPNEHEIAQMALDHDDRLVTELEQALRNRDADRREAVLTFLLPELLQVAPDKVVQLLARLPQGEPRETLRMEMARQWVAQDCEAAVHWLKSIDDPHAQQAAVRAAVDSLEPVAPGLAADLARQFHQGAASGRVADRQEPGQD